MAVDESRKDKIMSEHEVYEMKGLRRYGRIENVTLQSSYAPQRRVKTLQSLDYMGRVIGPVDADGDGVGDTTVGWN